MFASNREAMMCHITSVVYVIVDGFDVQEFWKKHLGTYGSTYLTIDEPVDDEWARSVIDDAISRIP